MEGAFPQEEPLLHYRAGVRQERWSSFRLLCTSFGTCPRPASPHIHAKTVGSQNHLWGDVVEEILSTPQRSCRLPA